MTRGIKTALASAFLATVLQANGSVREEGIAAFNQGRYSLALAKLQEATKDPSDKTAAIFLSLTQAAAGDCKTALPRLTAKDGRSPTTERLAGLAAANCYSVSGDSARTFSLLADLQRRYPDDPDILYTSAKLHMKAFNDATFAMFQRTPSSYRVHELSAEIFDTQGRYADAAAEYRKAIDVNANAPGLHYRLGRSLLAQGHSSEALAQAADQFRAELRLSPEDSASEYQLGQIAQVSGDKKHAQLHFEQALADLPNFAAAMISLGKIYIQEKQYDRAQALLGRAIELQPQNEAAHYALLTLYRDTGQMTKAQSEKATLDRLQKPLGGEFSDFLKKLGEKQNSQ